MRHSRRTHLYGTLAGQSCRTLLWDTLVEHSCRTFLWAALAKHYCGTLFSLLWDASVGHSKRVFHRSVLQECPTKVSPTRVQNIVWVLVFDAFCIRVCGFYLASWEWLLWIPSHLSPSCTGEIFCHSRLGRLRWWGFCSQTVWGHPDPCQGLWARPQESTRVRTAAMDLEC